MRTLAIAGLTTNVELGSFAVDGLGDVRLVHSIEQLLRERDFGLPVALRLFASLPGAKIVERLGDDREICPGLSFIETENDVAGLDGRAVPHSYLANNSAGRMLYFLDVRIDDKLALRNHRAGKFSRRRPAAKTEHEDNGRNGDRPDVLLERSEHVWCICAHDCDVLAASLTTRRPPGGSNGRWTAHHLGHDLFLGSDGLAASLRDHHDLINTGQRARPMSDHDRNAIPRPDREDRACKGLVTLWIEIGIWLIEHDQERIAIKCTRKRNALTLACRKRTPVLADISLVPIGHFEDQLMNAGKFGGSQHLFRVQNRFEPADVLGDRAGEQFDVLRQVANVLAEFLGNPLIECRAVYSDGAPHRIPHTRQARAPGKTFRRH